MPDLISTARVDGQATTVERAVAHAAEILSAAKLPLIYGLTKTTCEAQAAAVAVAEQVRGALDLDSAKILPARGSTLQTVGECRATQGEIGHRAEMAVTLIDDRWLKKQLYLGANNPVVYELLPHVQNSAQFALRLDEWLIFQKSSGTGVAVWRKRTHTVRDSSADALWDHLFSTWEQAAYPVLIYEYGLLLKLTATNNDPLNAVEFCEQLERIVLAKARHGRASALPLELIDDKPISNAAGAEYVLTARTGYPRAVSFARGTAEFLPLESNAAALLARGTVDAALFVNAAPDPAWPTAAREHLARIPCIVMTDEATQLAWVEYSNHAASLNQQQSNKQSSPPCPVVQIPLRSFATEEAGTIVRGDGVPLPLRPQESAPNAAFPSLAPLLNDLLSALTKDSPSRTIAAKACKVPS